MVLEDCHSNHWSWIGRLDVLRPFPWIIHSHFISGISFLSEVHCDDVPMFRLSWLFRLKWDLTYKRITYLIKSSLSFLFVRTWQCEPRFLHVVFSEAYSVIRLIERCTLHVGSWPPFRVMVLFRQVDVLVVFTRDSTTSVGCSFR